MGNLWSFNVYDVNVYMGLKAKVHHFLFDFTSRLWVSTRLMMSNGIGKKYKEGKLRGGGRRK